MVSTECQEKNKKSYAISADQVKPDNSDLFRYSSVLGNALKKCRFSKSKPEIYIDFFEAAGISGTVEPFEDIDLRVDIERFITTLSETDSKIFKLYLFKLTQTEIAKRVGVCQATVCNRLKALTNKFAEFYLE